MNTFHKIVLAIAGSLNNGISSLAPQGGNRALINKPNALAPAFAERQEPTSAKTPLLLNRIGKGIGKFWIPAIALVLPAFVAPNDAQAQRQAIPKPDYEIYGKDKYTYELKINGSWHTELSKTHIIYEPSNTRDEYASYIYRMPKVDWRVFGLGGFPVKRLQATKWFKDGNFKNRLNRDVFFVPPNSTTNVSYGHVNPARYTKGKEWTVGVKKEDSGFRLFSREWKKTWTYKTKVDFTANHTTGGKVNFLVTITYSIEGSAANTKTQTTISLAPGETTTLTLSVPNGSGWADIRGIDVMANRQPNPIQVSPQNRRASPDDVLDSLVPPDVYFGPGTPPVPRPPKKKPTPPVNQN